MKSHWSNWTGHHHSNKDMNSTNVLLPGEWDLGKNIDACKLTCCVSNFRNITEALDNDHSEGIRNTGFSLKRPNKLAGFANMPFFLFVWVKFHQDTHLLLLHPFLGLPSAPGSSCIIKILSDILRQTSFNTGFEDIYGWSLLSYENRWSMSWSCFGFQGWLTVEQWIQHFFWFLSTEKTAKGILMA